MSDCDIVMPVWNQLEITKNCIASIEKNTSHPFRLIVVDNASGEETRLYLEGLRMINGNPVLLIRNDENAGFIKAVNQGMAVSKAPYVCILNNDTIVTGGWLDQMIAVADSNKSIGIVNPSSNNLGQRPEKNETIESYSKRLKEQAGKFIELGAAIGFCMLIKREVIEKIGLFDEIYGMGNFEDTDFSRRATKEGYLSVRACGVYVYHRENSSFNRIKTFEDDFKRNKAIYEFRWGKPKRIAYILNPSDMNVVKKLQSNSMKLARGGNWVWYFTNDCSNVPAHSNIICKTLPVKNFYLNVIIKILTKKKKFDEIFVGEGRLGRILERISFIHKAKVSYY